jgi:DNA-binding CsgD family transcriptional regulator
LRTDAVHLLGVTQMLSGDPLTGHSLLVQEADRLESEDPRRAAALLLDAALAYMETGDMHQLAETAVRTRRLFQRAGDPREALAGVQLAQARIALGDPSGGPLLDAHERFLLDLDLLSGAHELVTMAAVCWYWLEEYERSERLLQRTISTARAATALRALPLPLAAAAQLEVRRGRWAAAERFAAEGDQLASETRSHFVRPFTLYCLGQVDALRGREAPARSRLLRSRQINDAHGFIATNYHVEATLGQLELALGRLPEAVLALTAARAIYVPACGGEPGLFSSAPDLVEACVRSRQTTKAERTLEEYAVLVQRTGRSAGRAALARCRGLLDDDRAADAHFELALREHRAGVLPFERARTHLLYGECLRRTGRRVDARQQLGHALTTFQRLGAPHWVRRAEQELAASGARVERRDHVLPERLTRQERRVAQLVVDGATNREAADALFLSPKTVEAHLRQVFRKVGVRSRTELVALGVRGDLEPLQEDR